MTAAALAAEALDGCLREQRHRASGALAGLGRRFHERQAAAVAPCWTLTANSDRQWSVGRVKDLGPARRLLHGVSGEVMALAVEREEVARTLLEVKNLLEPPLALLRPGILLPALRRMSLSFIKSHPTRSKEPGESPRPSEKHVCLRT